ncbi:terpenoid cyclases/Protein prenyltransferase [Lactarius indigo]|nr:terpenoid cyclases/Protein prenyltransferase [Lactarius indigo]
MRTQPRRPDLQADTEDILQEQIPPDGAGRVLDKNAHLQFLVRNFAQGFPARYMSQDASQPWLMFWTLQAFSTLQIAIDPDNKQRAIDTIMRWQHPDGGFGGGPGQAAHLLATYASVCSLAIVGRPGPEGGWDQINREKLYKWYMSLKRPDGSFIVSNYGEVDVRGIYCLLVVAHLLDIVTPELINGTAAFIASCQTYEGGFSSASHPHFVDDVLSACRPSLGHTSSADDDAPRVDTRRLLRWLVHMQGSEIELGGFKGRTNKLVDGCYSWWVGGAFALLEALGVSGVPESSRSSDETPPPPHPGTHTEDGWDDVDDSLFSRRALQEYILIAGQHPAGGLRDKPPKQARYIYIIFFYYLLSLTSNVGMLTPTIPRTCISGLSIAQHRVCPSPAWRAEAFAEALSWTEEAGGSHILGSAANRVNATHPLFNLTITHTEGIMAHFYKQSVPKRVPKRSP